MWMTHPPLSMDPTRTFALGWQRLRKKYKDLQTTTKKTQDPLEDLHVRLAQLKLDILEDSTLFQTEEFQDLRIQIREAKLTKANQICSSSHVKFLGAGDEPYKTFLTLLKEEQLQEAMHLLLTHDNICIKYKDEILWEI